jgi:DNA-directed RNA polymerase subunit RPC12/RpoP
MVEQEYCYHCGTAAEDADISGNACAQCRHDIVFAADDEARERAIERRVEEHLDREEERRHG